MNIAGFKENGAIEYIADTLFGLQYAGFDYQERESDKARNERLREEMEKGGENIRNGLPVTIQIKVLKQRNGVRGSTVLHFHPRYNGYEAPVAPFGEQGEE